MQTKLLLNGSLVQGEGEPESVLDPATGKQIAQVPAASRAQVDAAVAASEGAFDSWSWTTPKDRAALLLRLADRIDGDGAGFAELESRNTGKPIAAMQNDEIPAISDVFRFTCGRCAHPARAPRRGVPAGFHQHGAP